MRKCSVEGCEGKHYGKGLCHKHYVRVWNGKPLLTVTMNERGKGSLTKEGYRKFGDSKGNSKLEHVMIAEKALGRPLKRPEQVHHVDCNPLNNAHSNLVICPDDAYHKLLHRRQRALDECGHVDWVRCGYCGKHGPMDTMYVHPNANVLKTEHIECRKLYNRAYQEKLRARKNA